MHADNARKTLANIKKNKFHFQCRLCDSAEYLPQYQNNGIIGPGYEACLTHFVCAGCGVHFSDPEKFSKKSQ
jgi:hypothetical protein